jgi:hypothetical protein
MFEWLNRHLCGGKADEADGQHVGRHTRRRRHAQQTLHTATTQARDAQGCQKTEAIEAWRVVGICPKGRREEGRPAGPGR